MQGPFSLLDTMTLIRDGGVIGVLIFILSKGLPYFNDLRKELRAEQQEERKLWQDERKEFIQTLKEITQHLHELRSNQDLFETKLVSAISQTCKAVK